MNRVDPEALSIASRVARALTGAGAEAVVLTGSHARGDAHPESDLDLHAIGDGPLYRLERQGAMLVSVSWSSRAEIETAFTDPARAGGFIPGWRQAVILEDPHRVADRTIERANAWTWDAIGQETIDRHVAEGITGYAEEVHKLVALLGKGEHQGAAVQRSVLALRLPILMSIHRRLLYDSENVLWDLVASEMGDEWSRAQKAALGVLDLPFKETCHAALKLFDVACVSVTPLFNNREYDVVCTALEASRGAREC